MNVVIRPSVGSASCYTKMNPYETVEIADTIESPSHSSNTGDEGYRNHLPIAFALSWNLPLALFLLLAIVGKISSRQADWLYFLWASSLPIVSTTIALVEPLRRRLVLPSISRTKSRNGLLFFAALWIVILCVWYTSLISRQSKKTMHELNDAPKSEVGFFEIERLPSPTR